MILDDNEDLCFKIISGWYESDYGIEGIYLVNIKDLNDLSRALTKEYGDDWKGVDMELSGEYTNGVNVESNYRTL